MQVNDYKLQLINNVKINVHVFGRGRRSNVFTSSGLRFTYSKCMSQVVSSQVTVSSELLSTITAIVRFDVGMSQKVRL